jgi:hypothetical protein
MFNNGSDDQGDSSISNSEELVDERLVSTNGYNHELQKKTVPVAYVLLSCTSISPKTSSR